MKRYREISPFQLTTSRIGNLTWLIILIISSAAINTIFTYIYLFDDLSCIAYSHYFQRFIVETEDYDIISTRYLVVSPGLLIAVRMRQLRQRPKEKEG